MEHNVYDFDKTIYKGDSTVDFYKYCLKNKPVIFIDLIITVFYSISYFLRIKTLTQYKEVFFRFLRRLDDAESLVLKFWSENSHKIADFYIENRNGNDIVISASPEFLLSQICKILGIKYLIATKVDIATGLLISENCKGKEKLRRLRKEMGNVEVKEFYSDSFSDLPLAKIAESAFLVRGKLIVPWHEYQPTIVDRIKNIYFSSDFILFVFCGGMGTLTNFIFSLFISIRMEPTLSYVLGYGISLFVAYALNACLVFKKKLQASDFLKFVISYIPNFLILFTFVFYFLNILHWNKVLVYALAGLLGLPMTFILVKIFAFGRKDSR